MPLPLPETLTPSKISRFMQCPQSFRYSYIDKLPEPPTIYQFLGTLVHRALQIFFAESAGEDRSVINATVSLDRAWQEALEEDGLSVVAETEADRDRLRKQASVLLDRYFELENPRGIDAIGIELDLRVPLEHVEMRGIIDRLDRLEDGSLAIVDYKTGRAPRQDYARSSLIGVHFYAYLCEQVFGERPREVRLMYLKDRVVVVETPTDQTMRGLRQRSLAVWNAIERACETDGFRPNPSRLCAYCAHQSICPAQRATTSLVALQGVR